MGKSGRAIVWLIIAMIVAALAYRFWPRGSSSTDAPPADAVVEPTRVEPKRVEPKRVEPPKQPIVDTQFTPSVWQVYAISTAGDKVLLYRDGQGAAYRVVVIATGLVEAEHELSSHQTEDEPSDATLVASHVADYQKLWPLLKEFPLGAAFQTAATPDGKRGAFGYNDQLYVMRGGKPFKVPLPAAYAPMIVDSTVLFRGYDGQWDGPGTGRYSLFAMSLDSGKPTKIAATLAAIDNFAVSSDGKTLRIVVAELPWVAPCVLEIPLAAPFKVTRKRCVDGDGHIALSRHGDRFAWSLPLDVDSDATIGRARMARQRVRVLELERGSVPFDQTTGGSFLISDRGRMVIEDAETTYDIDGATTREVEVARIADYCKFIDDSRVVCPHQDAIKVVDLSKLPSVSP